MAVVTPARLLRLLNLLSARPWWAGPELADRLEVTERTLRRDVTRLRGLGYPIEGTTGPYGGYRLGAAGPPALRARASGPPASEAVSRRRGSRNVG